VTIVALTDLQSRLNFFQERILLNLDYWRSYLSRHEITALEAEQNQIIKAITFALEMPEAWPSVYELILRFSPYMERRGYWEAWSEHLGRAIEAAQESADLGSAITLSVLLARLLQRQSRLEEAIAQYRRIIPMARQSQNLFEEARACTNLGYLYIEEGYWDRAEVLCCHALTLFEQVKSDHGQAHTENHLGILYTRQGLWEQARQRLEHACTLWEARGDAHGLMRGFINLGLLYDEMNHPDAAIIYLEKALQQAKLAGEEVEVGAIYMNMGIAFRLKKEPVTAERYARQAETIFRRFFNSVWLPFLWINLAGVYIDQERWSEADQLLTTALSTCRNLKNEQGEIKALLMMVEYELARGNLAQAVTRLNAVEDLIRPHQRKKQYRYLEMQFLKYQDSLPRNYS
jgi:tetratricopeptide (TPR) repeat protein